VGKRNESAALEFEVYSLLRSPTVTIQDTKCQGSCRSLSPEESTATTQLIFPYCGVYVRHVGQDQTIAEANQVLFFNANEGYRVSHPVAGGDGSLTLVIEESQLEELAPPDTLHRSSRIRFRRQRLRIDARAQALVALLRHRLHEKVAESLAPGTGRSSQARAVERSHATLDFGRDRRRITCFSCLSHSGFPTSRGIAVVSVPITPSAGALVGPSWTPG